MKFNKQADLYKKTRVSDGMGGWDEEVAKVGTIKIATTPVKAELALKEYGIVSTSSLKLFTKDAVPDGIAYLIHANKKYRILQLSDFGKYRMLLVEVTS